MKYLFGSSAAQTIAATNEASFIWGGGGGDVLRGGAGNDVIFSTRGDTISGGGGDDTLMIAQHGVQIEAGRGAGHDVVNGFGDGDSFRFTDLASEREIITHQVGRDFSVTVGGLAGEGPAATVVTFRGVDPGSMHLAFDETGHLLVTHGEHSPLG